MMMQLAKSHIEFKNNMVTAFNIDGSQYSLSMEPRNCDDNDTIVCRGIISKLLEENEHLWQEVRRLRRICC
ncbi:hypothetical protein SODG_002917 [Sodalis praecaptivus]|nr:hypothetical protein NVIRENTERO_02828 [Sodalis praecaptivus]